MLVVSAAQIGDCRYLLTEDLQENQNLGNIKIINPFHTSPESLEERWTSVSSPRLLKPPPCLEIEIHAAAFFMSCFGDTTTFPTSRPPMIAQGITKTLSAADYRERRLKDLEDRRNSEMWRAGTVVWSLKPEKRTKEIGSGVPIEIVSSPTLRDYGTRIFRPPRFILERYLIRKPWGG